MDSIIQSFELGTFPDSGIFLNIGDAGHVDPEREGDLVYFLTDTNGGPEVVISKQTAMLLYEDGYYAPNCTTIPWSDQIIYCEDALANMYDRRSSDEDYDRTMPECDDDSYYRECRAETSGDDKSEADYNNQRWRSYHNM